MGGLGGENAHAVQVRDWYDGSHPRTATATASASASGAANGSLAVSRPAALRGFYRDDAGQGQGQGQGQGEEKVDLIGGADLGQWLLKGARQRQQQRQQQRAFNAGTGTGTDEDDFMRFD